MFDLSSYTIRRKVFKFFGASFHVYDADGKVVGFSNQKAFKLKEDIRVFSDETKSREVLAVRARQIIDWSAAYDIVDSEEGRKIGAARRKGWSSLVRDSWEILDENDEPVAKLEEDSTAMALVRRFLSNLVPQKYSLTGRGGKVEASLRVHFNPFVYRLSVERAQDATLDPRLVLATAVLLAAIAQRQE